MTAQQIADKLEARPTGSGKWMARCPGPLHAHGDRSPSLSIGEGRDGRVLLHCFAGCTAEEICRAANLEVSELFFSARESRKSEPQIVRGIEPKIADLRDRLSPRERVVLEPVVILTTSENLDAAICRGLALAVDGELCQIVFEKGFAT